jgi:HEPN domain-containing protein
MPGGNEQAVAYVSEAETTLESARVLLDRDASAFAAQVVKNAYDAFEQALSAGVAARGRDVPRRHGAKIRAYFDPLDDAEAAELERVAFEWHSRRSDAQYVDRRGTDLSVPSENFDAEDARRIVDDAERIVAFVRREAFDGEVTGP